ncbi:MAG: hypothetical protein KJ955_08330 [Nanoarchaeota archaeon]|nr:hypothetical protein [Nanoarchaeota archaeon]
MGSLPWILISLVTLLILLLIFVIFIRKKQKFGPDYYAFFIMGIIWLAFGIPSKNFALVGMGFVFAIWGIAHKKEWKKNHKSWSQLTETEKKFKMWTLIVLSILVVAGLVAFCIAASLR